MNSVEPRPLPVGVSDFASIISNNGYYVDKTHLISRLLRHKMPRSTILFTRPRRFGKSLALKMLRCFFDCNAKEENRALFEGLEVSNDERSMAEQGKYPVIYINFKDVARNTYELTEKKLIKCLRSACLPFSYILKSDKFSSYELEDLQKLFDSKVELNDLSDSLKLLSWALATHHGQPAVILIDEYDVPMRTAYQNNFYSPMRDFMRDLFSEGLKDNDYLRLAVITGVMRIARHSIFSGLNNLTVDTILSEQYSDCFGFTQDEVNCMAAEFSREDKIAEIEAWYDGYRFGQSDIYNPWSVLQYFDKGCKPIAFWTSTSSNDLTISFLRRLQESQREQVWELYRGGSVKARFDTAVSYEQLKSLDPNFVFSLMAISGYLKPVERLNPIVNNYLLQVPNLEIVSIFSDEITNYLTAHNFEPTYLDLWYALAKGDDERFASKLKATLLQSVSFFDNSESFYHGFMTCLLIGLENMYQVLSNREAGLGRSDFSLKPRFVGWPGIVFEFKHSDNPADLERLADVALQQIEDKHYIADFTDDVKEVRCYGLAFCKKECVVKTKRMLSQV